jgi:uncharacterized glyoxalase superfamily protein PhnB
MNIPKHSSPVMPYMIVSNADGFIEFISDVFGAEEVLRVTGEDGSVMHGEYSINGGTIMFGQSRSEWPSFTSGMFVLAEDVDAVYATAISNGAASLQEPSDPGYGRAAGFRDPFGNQRWLNSPA